MQKLEDMYYKYYKINRNICQLYYSILKCALLVNSQSKMCDRYKWSVLITVRLISNFCK